MFQNNSRFFMFVPAQCESCWDLPSDMRSMMEHRQLMLALSVIRLGTKESESKSHSPADVLESDVLFRGPGE